MNVRGVAAELAALAAGALWVYCGTALGVAVVGDGESVSFGATAAVVALSYSLARLLGLIDVSETTVRLWGTGLSVGLLYLILRVEIAGELYLWELGWLGDLLADPGATLEGRAGHVTEVVLLAAAWVWSAARGMRRLTFEGALSEVSVGLVVVVLAAALAPTVDAPGALRWLAVPYMVSGLLSLALVHLRPVETDRHRPFAAVWAAWTVGSLGVIGGLALAAAFFDPPSLATAGHALATAARGVALAVVYVLAPIILAIGWAVQHLMGWLVSGDEFIPEMPDTGDLTERMEQENEPARWSKVIGYVLRSGLVVLAAAVAVAVLWFAFRRWFRRDEDEAEVREEVEPDPGGPLGDLRSILSGALGRLRGRATGRPRDAIGRLYVSVTRQAAADGSPRPASATPLEFAPRLERHFDSPVPTAISRAYAETRYGRRPPPRPELERLREQWREVERRRP